MSDNKDINFNLDPVPKSTKESLFNPTASALGKAGGGIASFVSIPFRNLGIWSENYIDNFETKLLTKNQSIPEENRDFSKFQQTAKAIDDAKYSLGEEELQEYFTNLISATLDNRKNQNIHPSFSSILKEFTTEDAKIFEKIYINERVPFVNIIATSENQDATTTLQKNILLFEDREFQSPEELDSLARSGLIKINDDSALLIDKYNKRYNKVKESDLFDYYVNLIKREPIVNQEIKLDMVDLTKGHIALTNIGKSFGAVVLSSDNFDSRS